MTQQVSGGLQGSGYVICPGEASYGYKMHKLQEEARTGLTSFCLQVAVRLDPFPSLAGEPLWYKYSNRLEMEHKQIGLDNTETVITSF